MNFKTCWCCLQNELRMLKRINKENFATFPVLRCLLLCRKTSFYSLLATRKVFCGAPATSVGIWADTEKPNKQGRFPSTSKITVCCSFLLVFIPSMHQLWPNKFYSKSSNRYTYQLVVKLRNLSRAFEITQLHLVVPICRFSKTWSRPPLSSFSLSSSYDVWIFNENTE